MSNPPPPPVVYSSFLNLAICNDSNCQYALKLDNVARHLRQVHSLSSAAASQLQSDLQSKQISLPDPLPTDRQLYFDTIRETADKENITRVRIHPLPLPPLSFLPVVQCVQCSTCGLIKQTKDAMKRHLRQCQARLQPKNRLPPSTAAGAPPPPPSTPVLAQSIFGGKNTAWFPVTSEQSDAILRMIQNDQGVPPGTAATETPLPHIDSFLSEMRFDVQLQQTYNLTMEEAYSATTWSSRPPFPYARRILAAYVHQAFTVAADNSYIKSHTILKSPLRLSLSTETLRAYIARLSRLLTFLFTVSDWPAEKRLVFMTNAQLSEVNQFIKLCTIGDADMTTALSKFHIIIRSIMFDPLDSRQSVIPLFIACSTVKLSPGTRKYRFGAASETSPMLAALKYLVKCAVVTHIYAFPRTAPDREEAWKQLTAATSEHADSGATVVASTLQCSLRLSASETSHINMVLCTRHSMCAIVDGHEVSVPTLASAVHALQHAAWTLLENKLMMGLILNRSFWTMLGSLQDALGEKSAGYWYLMHPNNYEPLNAWRRAYINAVHPQLFNSDASVKDKPAEEFVKNVETFQDYVYTLMQICSGGPARATESATLRIRNTAKATRGIFVSQGQLLTILTYTKTRCMQDGTGRSIVRCPDSVTAGFMHIFMILILPLHTLIRSQVNSQSSNPETEPPSQTHKSYTGALNPVSIMQPPNLPSIHDTSNPLDYIFHASSSDYLRTAFASCLSSVSIPLNTTQYRHFHSAVLKHYLPSAAVAWHIDNSPTSNGDNSDFSTMHLQAGHTEHTATRTYGVTRSQLTAITATEMQQFRNASQTWHKVLRLPTGVPIPFTDKVDPSTFTSGGVPSHQQQQHYRHNTADPPTDHAHPVNTSPQDLSTPTVQSTNGATSPNNLVTTAQIFARLDCMETSLNFLVSYLERNQSQVQNSATRATDAAAAVAATAVPGSTAASRLANSLNQHDVDSSNGGGSGAKRKSPSSSDVVENTAASADAAGASLSLQTFLQSPEAMFKSPQQKSAVLHALQPGKDLLVVMPTGSGKSLLFMLPAFTKPDKVCVVVVPLVALQQDLMQRCARKGITAARFSDATASASPGVRIVLVSAEQLVLPRYAAFLRTAAATERLHAIFIDEAHLVLLWRTFRTALHDVREFIRPQNVDVSIIAMTATCPPPLEQKVANACGMRGWDVLRSATTRPNIRYSVVQVAASNMLLAAAQLIARIAAEEEPNNRNADGVETMMILYIQNKARCNAVTHVFSLICPQVECLVYHADLTDEQRSEALVKWQAARSQKPRLMVATSAFGCGIDVPTVRCVLHLGLPSTVIDFLQESGRAGRDGMPSQSVIMHQPLPPATQANNSRRPHGLTEHPRENLGADDDSDTTVRFGKPRLLCTTPTTACRRWFLDSFADGVVDKRSCQVRKLQPCDHCSEQTTIEEHGGKQIRATSLEHSTAPEQQHQEQQQHQPANHDDTTHSNNIEQQADNVLAPGPAQHAVAIANTEFVTGNQVLQQFDLAAAAGADQVPAQPTPGHLRDLAERLAGTCVPCSVATGSLVRHRTQSAACFNNICLRCCGSGHKASVCTNLTLPPSEIGCYSCTLNKINGIVVHNVGTYGKRSCQLKLVFCYCICMWENRRFRASIHHCFENTARLPTTELFVDWLRRGIPSSANRALGIVQMVPFLQQMFCP